MDELRTFKCSSSLQASCRGSVSCTTANSIGVFNTKGEAQETAELPGRTTFSERYLAILWSASGPVVPLRALAGVLSVRTLAHTSKG